MSVKITESEIERRFAALDERIAEVDAALAHLQQLAAAMNARLLAHEEHTAAEVQAAASALDDIGVRVGSLELATVTADENGEYPGDVETAAAALPWVLSEDQSKWTALLLDGRMAVVERLDDEVSFLPRISAFGKTEEEATGPVCNGWIPAAAWAAAYVAAAIARDGAAARSEAEARGSR